jgi:hypothetical protein
MSINMPNIAKRKLAMRRFLTDEAESVLPGVCISSFLTTSLGRSVVELDGRF